MAIDERTVAEIAQLARLALDEAAIPATAAQLERVLSLAEQMAALELDGVEPMAHPLQLQQPLREDRVEVGDQREAYQAIAPAVAKGLYLVPKVIE